MINYYQPFLWPFLHTKPYSLPQGIKRYYYFSWEDALWDMLIQKAIPLGATILIPDFYCIDVVENIKNHGYKPVFYPLDDHFQIDRTSFAQILNETNPQVIIIFHAAGITSQLMNNLPDTTAIIIEDCVHRLVDPQDLALLKPNHIIMDSLRKDSPLPGSFIYGSPEFLSYKPNTKFFSVYFLFATYYFLLFRMALMVSALLNLPSLTKYAHEVILKKHDDIIGDSHQSHRGLPIFPLIHRFLNFNKVKLLKAKQVKIYQELTRTMPENFYAINFHETDAHHLHVFPLGLKKSISKNFLESLHRQGIIVWNKFPDSPWSMTRSVLFLPLGFHISDSDIQRTVKDVLVTS